MKLRRAGVAVAATAIGSLSLVALAPSFSAVARASTQPVEMAAPYEYLGWGSPPSPTQVMATTGTKDFTLAFILSHGACDPRWDGSRPLTGGVDASAINAIRAAGGDVVASFGGWNGKKLGNSCRNSAALAAAYQKVITAYSLKAIDIDIEHGEVSNPKIRQRVIGALAIVQAADPGLEISVTFGVSPSGPDAYGLSLISDAVALGFQPSAWTIMPFDFGVPVSDMGATSIAAARGLDTDLVTAYRESAATAYQHIGVSSMNGRTDEPDETVSAADFQTILGFAQANHLARLTFWSVNRDRPCAGGSPVSDSCSGISQQPFAFTALDAQFHG